jgi:hypothetical protein
LPDLELSPDSQSTSLRTGTSMSAAQQINVLRQNDKNLEVSEIETANNDGFTQHIDPIKEEDKAYTTKKAHIDALSVWGALKVYKRISLVCCLAAASA